jgi:hypothetical protein
MTDQPETATLATQADPATTDAVFRWLLSGATDFEIVEAIAAKFPTAHAPAVLAAIVDRLNEQPDPTKIKSFCFHATKQLFNMMQSAGDFSGALRALKQLHDLADKMTPPAADHNPAP